VRLPKFEFVEPKSAKEASSLLVENPTAKVLAGGTDLLVNMKHRVETPSILVNIKKIPHLDFVRRDNGMLRIGALTPLKKVYRNPYVVEKLSVLASAASSVGSYHHQVMGTIGGNICQQNRCKFFNQSLWWRSARPTCFKAGGEICHVVNKKEVCYSSYCGDVAPALLALNASVLLENARGSRTVPFESLFSGDGKTPLTLQKGEILIEILIPEEASSGFSTYFKFANRESIDFPVVGMAFWYFLKEKEYRVAFTAVDRKPLRAESIETLLNENELSKEIIEEASGLAPKVANPVKNSIYSPSYKRTIMGLLLRNAMNEATRRLQR
jgi:4-hydroxybenzoyl-CoA reductase subunit beta